MNTKKKLSFESSARLGQQIRKITGPCLSSWPACVSWLIDHFNSIRPLARAHSPATKSLGRRTRCAGPECGLCRLVRLSHRAQAASCLDDAFLLDPLQNQLPLSCSRIAGFSSVETSCATVSPLASDRNRRRMILPDLVFGRFSPKRISFGLAIGPISLAT